jgi:hypothetical protein
MYTYGYGARAVPLSLPLLQSWKRSWAPPFLPCSPPSRTSPQPQRHWARWVARLGCCAELQDVERVTILCSSRQQLCQHSVVAELMQRHEACNNVTPEVMSCTFHIKLHPSACKQPLTTFLPQQLTIARLCGYCVTVV